jgi:hypothetical protein
VRTLTAAIITVGLVASLSACATSGPSGSCEPAAKPGDASSLITAKGEPGDLPDVAFPTPLITQGLEVSTIDQGDGDTLYDGEIADFHLTVVDANTAEIIPVTGIEPDSILRRTVGDDSDEFGSILECATVGDRLGVTATAESIGFSGGGLDPDDTIVLVVDVVRSFMGRATGVPQLAVNGMPAIALAPSGQPGVTIPTGDAPTELRIATTILGDGEKVEKEDAVVAHVTRLLWSTRAVIDSTWLTAEHSSVPTTLFMSSDATGGSAGGVLPGLEKAMVGATVGSQLVVVIPPGEDGFEEGATLPDGVTAEDTLVYVVDILGVQD